MAKLGIIGGGAAGMMAAITAAQNGVQVHLFEHNEKLGKKLFITGKGRCNFTNACDTEALYANIVTNPRFMYSSFGAFTNLQMIDFVEALGVRTKVERGNRAFPLSDHSSDIIRGLERKMKELGVVVHLNSDVKELILESIEETATENTGKAKGKRRRAQNRVTGIVLANGARIVCDAVLVATGGVSYPSTGSTGDGYRFAGDAGHLIRKTRPALVPLETDEEYIRGLQGLSLKNVELRIPYGKKKEYRAFGEMLFTHFGVSGPLVLSASSYIGEELEKGPLQAEIDLKPALTEEQLDARLLREFSEAKNKDFKNAIAPLFPSKMRPVMVKLSGIPENKPVHEITREERQRFIRLVKAFPFTVTGLRSLNEAIITQGGVHVKEINPSTMESRITENLYFAGEVIDVDALTGGFNLQIAWSTAYLAATAIAEKTTAY